MGLVYCTDDKLEERISQGVLKGIPVQHLVESWEDELALYLWNYQDDPYWRPYFPVYGEPRVQRKIDDEDEEDEDD
jgi:hypothetical protein